MTVEGISLDPLERAYTKFNNFLNLFDSIDKEDALNYDITAAGCIQAFEYTLELSWKTMKKIMESTGIQDINNPKSVFRQAAREGFINDPIIWFEFLKARNETAHTYNEDAMENVVSILPQFNTAVHELLTNLRKKV